MAIARKCDRCGMSYEQYSKEAEGIAGINGFAFIRRRDGMSDYITEDHPRDLCPDCTESLLAWLKEKRGADNE